MCRGQEYVAPGDQVQLGMLGVIEGMLVGRGYVLTWDSCLCYVLQDRSLYVMKYGTQSVVWGCLLCFNGSWRIGGRFLTCIPDTSLPP